MAGKSWQPMSPHAFKGRQAPVALIKQWNESEGRGGGGILEDVLPHQTLTVNAIPVMATNTSQSEHTWNPGACTYQNTAEYQGNAGVLCCTSVELHLTALKLLCCFAEYISGGTLRQVLKDKVRKGIIYFSTLGNNNLKR